MIMNAIEAARHRCDQIRTPGGISGTIREGIDAAVLQRDAAIKMLAEWCVAVDVNGSGWDDWDEHYKDAMYRKTELPEIRELLDAAIAKVRAER